MRNISVISLDITLCNRSLTDRTEASDAFNAGSIPVGCICITRFLSVNFLHRDKGCDFMNKQEKKSGKKNSGKAFIDFLKENKLIAVLIVVVVVVLVAAAVIIGVCLGRGARPASSDIPQETESQEQAASEESESAETLAVPLEEDAYPAINSLMQEYYQAATDGDIEKIRSLTEGCDEETLIYLEKRSAYIEAYNNLKCYTKKAVDENSFVVYVSYEVKFKDMDTMVPGVSPYLVYSKEDGSYYIYEGEVDEEVNLYLEEISSQDDVVDLMNRVQVEFNDAVTENEELNNYLAQMTKDLKVEVGEALAEAEAAKEAESEQEQSGEGSVITASQVRATDVVNVRASDSEQAERIGKVQTGDVLDLIESKANGWSKVKYDGKEAFIKSEYLEPVGEENTDASQNQQNDNSSSQSANAGSNSDLPTSGTVMVADTVNIRKSASETAEKIGVCYQGGKLEILMQQADGWTKVKFEGKTGYVKTDVLKIMK